MGETFKAYFARLEGLSAEELDRSAVKLTLAEDRHVAAVIAHIAEISRRKVDLERGFQNLFDYCVRRLGLSEGSVALRIQVAYVARRFPQALACLAEGKIRLSVLGRLAPHLRAENVEKLLLDCAGMTKRAVEEYLVAWSPKPVFEPSIRKLPVAKMSGRSQGEGPRSTPRAEEKDGTALLVLAQSPGPPPPLATRPALLSLIEPARSDVYNFRFAAGKGLKEKLVRLAEVLGIENPDRHLAEIVERALDLALEKKDPQQKHERRLERERQRTFSAAESCPGKISDKAAEIADKAREISAKEISDKNCVPAESRYIAAEVRERVLERVGYQCQYTSPQGTRCTSRTGLEIEHAKPFAIFRSHDERFLLAYCPRHNLWSAEEVFGVEHIQGKIEQENRQGASISLEACGSP